MKKLVTIICLILPICALNAAQMCADTNTTTIVLDPSIQGLSYTYDAPSFTWQTSFSYGTINGVAACISSNQGKTLGQYYEGLTDGGTTVVGGEVPGPPCWCKMTPPAASRWVVSYTYSSDTGCANSCASDCGSDARNDSFLRGGLFGSVRN